VEEPRKVATDRICRSVDTDICKWIYAAGMFLPEVN